MAIDPYSLCPCGSGKKLKFCCPDLAGDIEKIHRLIAGDQPQAAIKHLEVLLAKQPDRASLLDLRAYLELSMHEFDAARKTIEHYLAKHPRNPAAHGQKAILLAATETGSAAIGALQDALELLDDDMPSHVFEAIGTVGHALLLEGELIAGRGHLLLYAGIAPKDDNMAIKLLLRLNLQSGLPLLIRELSYHQDCPDDAPWKSEFLHATRAIGRGQWRIAEEILSSLRDKAGAEPAIVYNLALVRGWLGDLDRFAEGLHEYARIETMEDRAVEAEALAQLIDPKLEDPKLETVRLVYAIGDEDALSQRFAEEKRVEDYPLEPDQFDEETPRPRSRHILLDKPTPKANPELQRDEIPRVLGYLSLYGKRTDRAAQLELTTDRGKDFEDVKLLLAKVTGDLLGDVLEEEVIAEKSLSEESLSWSWRFPPGTPPDQRNRMVAEERRRAILERWTESPRAALGNKSPRQAVGVAELRLALLASEMILEQAVEDPRELPLFAELREQLGLPAPARIDPTRIVESEFPIVRVPQLDLTKLTVEQLGKLRNRATVLAANLALLMLGSELVSRADRAEGIDLTKVFHQLVRTEPNLAQSQQWIVQARQWAEKNHRSLAEWALLDLEVAIERNDSATVQRTLEELRTVHINEPGIAEETYRILYSTGMLSPHESNRPAPLAMLGVQTQDSSTEPGSSDLWTPGGDSDEAPAVGSGKSAIWTP